MARLLRIALAVLAVSWITYIWWGHPGDASVWVWIASAIALAGIASTALPTTWVRTHAAIAAGLLASVAAFTATRIVGRWPFEFDAMGDPRYATFITVLALAIAVGLVCGAFWARWTALAFAAANLLGGALNTMQMIGARHEVAWLAAIGVIGGAAIWLHLSGEPVRAHFARLHIHAVWTSRDRLIRVARLAALANLAAAPMLLLYALGQPVAHETVVSALVLAPIVGLGAALVIARRSAGIALLALGGVGMIGHVAASLSYVAAANAPVVGYYAVFWLPAAILGITAGALAARRA
jgi:hypothetical protein